jgi:hypothetical protein
MKESEEKKRQKSMKSKSAVSSNKRKDKEHSKQIVDNDSQEKGERSYADKKVDAIYSFVKSPTNKLYVLFLNYTIHVFDNVLCRLQTEEPMIHLLRGTLHSLMRNILTRFVKPSAMNGKPLNEVDYKVAYNQKSDNELVIGEAAKKFVDEKETNHLRESRIKEFYSNVRQYFVSACDYIKKSLPLDDPVLVHAEVADTEKRLTVKASSLEFFIKKFPCLLPEGVSLDLILEEFALYQCQTIESDIEHCKRIDEKWNLIGQMKNDGGSSMFKHLSYVMRGILCIPHSSAHCERVFSVVRKNRTDQRASLSDQTLEALLVLKLRPGPGIMKLSQI